MRLLKKIRADKKYWQEVETIFNKHQGTQFSPGICPDCYERVMAPQLRKLGVGPTLPKETEREERPGMPVGLRWRTGLR